MAMASIKPLLNAPEIKKAETENMVLSGANITENY